MSLLETLLQQREERLIALHERITVNPIVRPHTEQSPKSTISIRNEIEVDQNIEATITPGQTSKVTEPTLPSTEKTSMHEDVTLDLKNKMKDSLDELQRRTNISIKNILRHRMITDSSNKL